MGIIAQFTKFMGVGLLGTIAHYLVLILLVQVVSINVVIASSIGAIVGAFVNYFLNYKFTFNSTLRHRQAITRYFIVVSVGFVLNGAIMSVAEKYTNLNYVVEQLIATGVVLLWNFIFSKYWAFRHKN